jgi:hypothetical protein
MVLAAVFHGNSVELHALMAAVDRNCTCSNPEVATGHCPAHRALLDQHWLDHVLFARHLAEQLLLEEFRA